MLGDKASHISSTGIEIKMHGNLAEANDSDAVIFAAAKERAAKLNDRKFLDSFHLERKQTN